MKFKSKNWSVPGLQQVMLEWTGSTEGGEIKISIKAHAKSAISAGV